MIPRYRVKWTLEDGRKVYISFRGHIDARYLSELSKVNFDKSLGTAAYSKDLLMFSQVSVFEANQIPYVRCLSYAFEKETDPIDKTAFVIGGRPVEETSS